MAQKNKCLDDQVLYAPFVNPSDKGGQKDVADMSLSDFYPKRFALNYDPSMIIIEYMVPSTGKLYHHRMKLRRLNGKSTVESQMQYLKKRHPLYMLPNNKINEAQIRELIARLIKNVKHKESIENSGRKSDLKSTSKLQSGKKESEQKPEESLKDKAKKMFDDLEEDFKKNDFSAEPISNIED